MLSLPVAECATCMTENFQSSTSACHLLFSSLFDSSTLSFPLFPSFNSTSHILNSLSLFIFLLLLSLLFYFLLHLFFFFFFYALFFIFSFIFILIFVGLHQCPLAFFHSPPLINLLIFLPFFFKHFWHFFYFNFLILFLQLPFYLANVHAFFFFSHIFIHHHLSPSSIVFRSPTNTDTFIFFSLSSAQVFIIVYSYSFIASTLLDLFCFQFLSPFLILTVHIFLFFALDSKEYF